MTKISVLIAAAAVALAVGPASAQKAAATVAPPAPATSAAAVMRPGLWEITVSNQPAGAEGRRMVVSRYCFAATDVGDLARVLPRQRESGMKCENRDIRPQGEKVSWQVACSSAEGSLAGPAEATLGATSYVGKAELEHKKKGAKSDKVTSTLSGKWIEACK